MTPSKSDRIAICGELFPFSLKQRLLFFDRIGVFDLNTIHKFFHRLKTDAAKGFANDYEYLQAKNFVFQPELPPVVFDPEGPREEAADAFSAISIFKTFEEERKATTKMTKRARSLQFSLLDDQRLFLARICARNMRQAMGLEASAIRWRQLNLAEKMQDEIQLQSSDVIDVVLDKLPMPSELTPWEAILDFKADKDAQGYLQGLKVWMSDLARQNLTATEASEKLDWLLFQHKKHLEMHKLKYRWGTFGGTFVAAAEILEDLAKIKWGKAAGAVVSIFDRRLELMKSELDNPAKEVSYIVKAQEQFGE
jgi:hypothetical protein